MLVPVKAREIVTPLIWQALKRGLDRHLDRWWAEYLVKGIREGFSRELCELRSNSRNMVSSGEQPQVVHTYLNKVVEEKRVWEVGARRGGSNPVQSVKGDPQEGKAWQVAVDTQPVSPGRSQCE